MGKYIIGIDNGSTIIKVSIFDLDGREVCVETKKCDVIMPKPGYYERSADEIWNANADAIAGALKKGGIAGRDVIAISLTGHGNGVILIGADDKPVCNTIESMDLRGKEYVSKWEQDGTYDHIHPYNLQKLWPALSLCAMAFIRDNHPELLQQARYFFTCKDYVRYMLTGEALLEISDISGSGLINTTQGRIDRDMLDMAGLGDITTLLPPLVQSTAIAGHISERAAARTGLKAGTPVVAGCYDIDAAALATGVIDERYINVIVGTWCNNQLISRTPVAMKEIFSTTRFCKDGYYLMLEGSPTSASNLEWFVEEFMQEEKKQARLAGGSVFDITNAAVGSVPPESAGIVFFPYLYGSNALANTKSVLLGLQGWHSRAHVLRAIYEGVCFSHKRHIEKIGRYMKIPAVARMAGGATRSDVWVQMFADILEMPIEITAATELGNLGAAMIAGVGIGIYKDLDEATERAVKVVKRVEPNQRFISVYRGKYDEFNRAIARLADFWGS